MTEAAHKLVKFPNLRERVYKILKGMIVSQEFPPGVKIDEEQLAKQLGVSRTPIRESLLRLENEGIVKIIPRRGASIVRHSREKIVELLLLREVLEGFAARLVAKNINETVLEKMKSLFRPFSKSNIRDRSKQYTQADMDFHNLVISTSKNSFLINMANVLNDHIQMLRLRTVSLKGRPEHSLQEHLMILQALEDRRPALAESLMKKHIENVRGSVMKNIDAD